jgi:aspartate dehydrogenase
LKRIGLLGCGAIGTQIALAVDSGEIPAVLTHLYDSDGERAEKLAAKLRRRPEVVANSHLLSLQPIDLVVEAASQDAVREAALGVLQNRKDIMIMSAGALLDESVLEVLGDACREFRRTVYLPSGAIAGLDGIRSAAGELDEVTLTTTKHPNSLRGAPFFERSDISPDGIAEATTIFEGSAGEAVSLFPANINVAALLSMAGLGSERTVVRIVADPSATRNTHRIEASGKFGRMTLETGNVPDWNNPKTSRLAILSAIDTLRRICSGGIQVGA